MESLMAKNPIKEAPTISNEEFAKMQVRRMNAMVGHLTNCDKCLGRGFYHKLIDLPYDHFHEVRVYCDCYKTRVAQNKINDMGMKYDVSKGLLNNFEVKYPFQKVMKDKAIAFLKSDNPILFYCSGATGIGKTTLIQGMLAKYVTDGENLKFMRWMSDSAKLKAMINTAEYDEEYNKFATAKILIIDDFLKVGGNEKPTQADIKLVRTLIDDRMYGNRITLITTELPPATFNDIDTSLASRLYEATQHGKHSIYVKDGINMRCEQMAV